MLEQFQLTGADIVADVTVICDWCGDDGGARERGQAVAVYADLAVEERACHLVEGGVDLNAGVQSGVVGEREDNAEDLGVEDSLRRDDGAVTVGIVGVGHCLRSSTGLSPLHPDTHTCTRTELVLTQETVTTKKRCLATIRLSLEWRAHRVSSQRVWDGSVGGDHTGQSGVETGIVLEHNLDRSRTRR